jgi:NADPH:quinone reductase-like Zn-dependent oxidoreductase
MAAFFLDRNPIAMNVARLEEAFGIVNVRVVEQPQPEPGPGQVLVRLRAASLNYRDLLVSLGKYNPKMPLPRTLLSDGAGEVVALGAGVRSLKVGERVAGIFMQDWLAGPYQDAYAKSALGGAIDGVLAEYVVFPENGVVPVPAELSYEEAATLPCAAVTAWNALFESGRLRAGQTLLVQGSGGVSVFALQFAKAAGARVIATTSSSEKAERLRALGADWVVNYRDVEDWGKVIAKAGGVDHVVEVGGVTTLEQSLLAVNGGGTVSIIGILSGILGQLNIAPILHKHLTLQGIYVGSRAMFLNMNRAITQNGLKPQIDCVHSMQQIQDGLRHMQDAGHFGKIVISI